MFTGIPAGDIQLVHNHNHAARPHRLRGLARPGRRRHLPRLWLPLPMRVHCPKIFAQRYGTVTIGDRGGIIVRSVAGRWCGLTFGPGEGLTRAIVVPK